MMYSEDYARAALDGLRKPIPEMALDASVTRESPDGRIHDGARRWLRTLSGCRAAKRN